MGEVLPAGSRLLVAVDPVLVVEAGDLMAAWAADGEAVGLGTAGLEAAGGEVFLPGLAELVVVPLLVNVASSVVYDVVKRLVAKLRGRTGGSTGEDAEVVVVTRPGGDRVVVVRSRRRAR